jgi:hypothetical protein
MSGTARCHGHTLFPYPLALAAGRKWVRAEGALYKRQQRAVATREQEAFASATDSANKFGVMNERTAEALTEYGMVSTKTYAQVQAGWRRTVHVGDRPSTRVRRHQTVLQTVPQENHGPPPR